MADLKPPIFTISLGGKGGIGKSMFSLAYLDLCELNGVGVDVMQLDDQARLEKSLKRQIVSLDLRTAKRARQDPKALTKTFAPLHEALVNLKQVGRSLHLDVGATQQHSLFDYAGLVALDEDLQDFGVTGIAFIILTADAEAIGQAARALDSVQSILSSLHAVLVVNERDGSANDLPHDSGARREYDTLVAQHHLGGPVVRMPLIPAGSWQSFERHSMRFLDVVAMDTQNVMSATGLSRPEAKLARGDVQAAFDLLEQDLAMHIPFFRSGEIS